MADRPPVGTKVSFVDGLGVVHGATVVPTHRQAPPGEVDIMFDITGSNMTIDVNRLTVTTEIIGRKGHHSD